MSWRDNLREASFRGVPFKVETISTEVGRRNVLYEYPFRDLPALEDLGKAAGMYSVVGYVIQNTSNDFDYTQEKDDLIEALETEGSGLLVHPFYGELTVGLIGKARIDESLVAGSGVARFQMTFAKIDDYTVVPVGEVDYEAAIESAADVQIANAVASFVNKYKAFSAGLTQATSDVQSAINLVRGTLYMVRASTVSTISQLQTAVASIYDTIDDVVGFPDDLADAISNVLDTYTDLLPVAGNSSLVDACVELIKFGELASSDDASSYGGTLDSLYDAGTENSDNKIENRRAIVQLVRIGAAMKAAYVSMNIAYDSYGDAVAMMNKLVEAIDDVLAYIDVNDDELYSSLQDFKPLIVAGLQERGASLPLVVDYEVPSDVVTTLYVAHDLYEDLDREDEIIDRNKLAALHPGFLPSGDTLEVLNE